MTQITTTKRICEHLEKYVYDRIWNEPYTEYRTYTRPVLLNKVVKTQTPVETAGGGTTWVETTSVTPVTGFYSGRYSHILLPPHKSPDDLNHWLPTDSSRFFLYTVPDRYFDSVRLDVKEWTLLSDYCNENCIDLHVFTPSGFFLNRGAIYICQADINDCMFLAIDADMVLELFGDFSEVGNVLFGKYVDSDGISDNKITVSRLTQSTIRVDQTTHKDTNSWEDYSYLLYNGKLVTGDYTTVATTGAYLEGVKDEDIVGYFEVDCDLASRPSYMDTKSGTPVECLLVHVPKEINPDRYLITPHTCDMWLVPTEMAIGRPIISGSYISLAGMDSKLHQITHSDFAIDMSYLTSIASSHLFTKYKLRVYVRFHNKKKEFVRDYNYIDMLYNLEDEEIIQFLRGKHEWQQVNAPCNYDPNVTLYWYVDTSVDVGWSCVQNVRTEAIFNEYKTKYGNLYKTPSEMLLFWKADHLEDCKYANALIRRRNGKYQSAATQCSRCPNQSNCRNEKAILKAKQEDGTASAWEIARIAELAAFGINESGTGTVTCTKFVKCPDNQCSICGLLKDTAIDGTVTDICTRDPHARDSEKASMGYDCPYYHLRSMRDYVQILGYFHVLSLVGKHVWHFKVTKDDIFNYSILAPLALSYPELNPTDFHCIVYHNGYRVDQERITVSSTNKDNSGAEEMDHGTGCLSRSTLVIQSNFATKLMVAITPKFEDCPHHRVLADKNYYKLDENNKLVSATISKSKEEFDEMSREQQLKVDYIIGELINKDKTTSYFLTPDANFTTRVYFGKLDSEEEYTLLVPGEDKDYLVNDSIAEFCEDRSEEGDPYHVYYRAVPLQTEVREFVKGDTVAIDVFDNRRRINTTTGEDEPCIILPVWTSPDARTVTTYTDNQYKLYKISTVTRNGKSAYRYTKVPDDEMGELSPDPSGKSFTLTINPTLNNYDLLFLEGPKTIEKVCSRTIKLDTFGSLGSEFFDMEGALGFPLDAATIFLNNKRLIPNLDYYLDRGDPAEVDQIRPYVQNLSYIWNGSRATQVEDVAKINFIRSNTTDISTQYGFMIGKKITWAGQAPFWFDELSTLTVDGALCSNFKHSLGMVEVQDADHRNGSPYEIRTTCSTRVMEIVGCRDEQAGDMKKIREVRTFFEIAELLPRMEVIIPHSHKIYSTYLEAICNRYLNDSTFTFNTHKATSDTSFTEGKKYYVKQAGSLRPITDKERAAGMKTGVEYYEELGDTEFKNQFAAYTYLKNMDIAYQLSKFDFGFVDVYPMYHRASAKNRDEYNKLRYLNNRLAPVDHIKHKDAIHE